MDIGGYSATGPRNANEDSFYYRDFSDVDSFANGVIAFIMVSDGMGGYECGDVASRLAVASAKSYISQLLGMADGNMVDLNPSAALSEIAQNAHDAIIAEAQSRGFASMGATYVAAFVSKSHAWIGHVGDSRAYLIRGDAIAQITEDHSRVGRMLSHGVITEREAQNHPERNKIERALGFSDPLPDINEVEVGMGDSILLCSDGAYTVLDSKMLKECVASSSDSLVAATKVVNLAIKKGTDDNTTAVVLCNRANSANSQTHLGKPKHESRNAERTAQANPYKKAKTPAGVSTRTIAVATLLVGLILGVMAMLAIHNIAPEKDASTQDGSVATGEQLVSGDAAASRPSDAEKANNTMTLTTMVELKYVDHDGLAQLFSYEPLCMSTAMALREGSVVETTDGVGSYGRTGKAYLTLSDAYRESLINDYARYCDGAKTFDSNTATLINQNGYLEFFEELYDKGMEPADLDETILHLIFEDQNSVETS